MERRLSPIHFVALAITSLIFIIGLLLGWQMGYAAENQMQSDFERLRSESYMLEVLSLLRSRGEVSCPILQKEFTEFSGRTLEYGERLEYLEKKLGKLDQEVMRLKSDYMLMQARNYLLLKGMDEDCGTEHIVAIYFYSNEGYSITTDQGIALGSALSSMPEIRDRTVIYHFDANVRNSVVDAFKEQYSVRTVPTTIIDGVKYEGFMDTERCKEVFSQGG
ncbi:MAG: hypothetical protein ABIG39_03005 [Candidatus Micrarchaeota archaeon]